MWVIKKQFALSAAMSGALFCLLQQAVGGGGRTGRHSEGEHAVFVEGSLVRGGQEGVACPPRSGARWAWVLVARRAVRSE